MPTLELETMRCVVDDQLGRLHLDRPEALNAANWACVRNLVQAVAFLKEHEEAHVVIVSGERRSFCSGLDKKELSKGNLSIEWFDVWEQCVSALANLPAITIAAIQGYCLGGGLQLAAACDLLVASTDAILSIPAVKEGVVADLGVDAPGAFDWSQQSQIFKPAGTALLGKRRIGVRHRSRGGRTASLTA